MNFNEYDNLNDYVNEYFREKFGFIFGNCLVDF